MATKYADHSVAARLEFAVDVKRCSSRASSASRSSPDVYPDEQSYQVLENCKTFVSFDPLHGKW
jgi:hypothetical protein